MQIGKMSRVNKMQENSRGSICTPIYSINQVNCIGKNVAGKLDRGINIELELKARYTDSLALAVRHSANCSPETSYFYDPFSLGRDF